MDLHLRYLIVDDDELDRIAVQQASSRYSFLHQAGICENAVEAFELAKTTKPDILFADVEMPDINGIELLRQLTGIVPIPVLITSHATYALDGFQVQAFDYILKPLTTDRFATCISRIRDFWQMRSRAFSFDTLSQSEYIIIRQGYEKHKLPVSEILYLEAMKDYTKIVTEKNNYLVLELLSNLLGRLSPDHFTRIHRSYAVHRRKVDSVKQQQLFVQGHMLPVGKSYKHILNDLPDTDKPG